MEDVIPKTEVVLCVENLLARVQGEIAGLESAERYLSELARHFEQAEDHLPPPPLAVSDDKESSHD